MLGETTRDSGKDRRRAFFKYKQHLCVWEAERSVCVELLLLFLLLLDLFLLRIILAPLQYLTQIKLFRLQHWNRFCCDGGSFLPHLRTNSGDVSVPECIMIHTVLPLIPGAVSLSEWCSCDPFVLQTKAGRQTVVGLSFQQAGCLTVGMEHVTFRLSDCLSNLCLWFALR